MPVLKARCGYVEAWTDVGGAELPMRCLRAEHGDAVPHELAPDFEHPAFFAPRPPAAVASSQP